MSERPAPAAAPAATFDQQARHYDHRAGLPPAVSATVARAVHALARAGAPAAASDLIVEVGAGTGEIGRDLARLPGRYLGLDASRPMLALFQAKAAPATPWLLVANAGHPWPLRDGAAGAVFAARVAHLLPPAHLAAEARRVGQPGAWLLLGRVERDRASVAERLNHQRRQLLAGAGLAARAGEAGTRRVIDECLARGATFAGRQTVATWDATVTPADVLAGWATQTRMGAVAVPGAQRDDILRELARWAAAEMGALDQPVTSPTSFVIDIIRFP